MFPVCAFRPLSPEERVGRGPPVPFPSPLEVEGRVRGKGYKCRASSTCRTAPHPGPPPRWGEGIHCCCDTGFPGKEGVSPSRRAYAFAVPVAHIRFFCRLTSKLRTLVTRGYYTATLMICQTGTSVKQGILQIGSSYEKKTPRMYSTVHDGRFGSTPRKIGEQSGPSDRTGELMNGSRER